MTLHDVMQGFKSGACAPWLGVPSERANQYGKGIYGAQKRRQLLEDFLFWLFDSYILSLIKVCTPTVQLRPGRIISAHSYRLDDLLRDRVVRVQEPRPVFSSRRLGGSLPPLN